MDFLKITPEKENEDGFKEIARILFDNYAIQKDDQLYRLIEIEFYWNSKTHSDQSTYGRNHIQPKGGDWFFHYSGVDIALDNSVPEGTGGILIRGIYDLNEKKVIKGPMVCAMTLFSGFNAFEGSIQTKLIQKEGLESFPIKSGPRKGLGKNAQINGMHERNYAFSIDPKK
ncbi:hypothetical protein DFQ04_2550 [Algoriphagus boseongensis]|uniref:Uncharacterized protein n=1 Tax=Algoriphagus boseongensis TaxID=1442587 RepID=A0A4R6T3W9_9BACT|nr:hypothetical protein [Algoriphagus boseongensis]TDQ16432.1 hypothetical protein DFQ04_2550 [Algoriphagus boseongensis]